MQEKRDKKVVILREVMRATGTDVMEAKLRMQDKDVGVEMLDCLTRLFEFFAWQI